MLALGSDEGRQCSGLGINGRCASPFRIASGGGLEVGEGAGAGGTGLHGAGLEREALLLALNHLKERHLALLVGGDEIALRRLAEGQHRSTVAVQDFLELRDSLTRGGDLGGNS